MDFPFYRLITRQGGCVRFSSCILETQSYHSMRNTMYGSSLLCDMRRSSFPVYSRSSNEKKRADRENFSDSGKIMIHQGVHKLTDKSGKNKTRSSSTTGNKDHFHNWSSRKIGEVGPLAVPVVEELRKSFAPGTQPLQHDTILKELNHWKSLSSIDVNSSSLCISVANERKTNDKWMERNGKASLSPLSRSFRKEKDTGKEGQNGELALLREFPTYHATEEALYFHNLLAYPWEKHAFERYVSNLEEKFFPDDLLDFDKPSLASRRRRNECSGTSQNVVFGNGRMKKHKEEVPSLNNASNQSSFSASAHNSGLDEGIKGSQIWKKGQEQGHTRQKGFSTLARQPVEELGKAVRNQASVKVSTIGEPYLLTKTKKLPLNWDGDTGTVVLIDKPKGWTSFAVCAQLRRLLNIQKVGHAGTLDPMATGLLVVCVGKATKLADSYQAMVKVYSGVFRLGEATPSYDADLEICERLPWSHVEDIDVQRVKESFIGNIMQVPPMYSAIKVAGERLHKKARQGEQIEIPPRMVSIYDLKARCEFQSCLLKGNICSILVC